MRPSWVEQSGEDGGVLRLVMVYTANPKHIKVQPCIPPMLRIPFRYGRDASKVGRPRCCVCHDAELLSCDKLLRVDLISKAKGTWCLLAHLDKTGVA